MLRFDNVTYAYPFQEQPSVREVSFTVPPGTLTLCTGPSGCGKSTLVRLANGLCPQYFKGRLEGSVSLNGFAAASLPLHLLADQVGSLFQNPEEQFFALRVEDELAFAAEWQGLEPEETSRRVRAVSRDFNLGPILDSSVHQLSEGQKQKVGLGAVMAQSPAVLVLDEPSANLDPEATLELARHLAALKARGLAILVVDHRLYWLSGIADQVLVMRQGRIAAKGSFDILHDEALRARCGLRRAGVPDKRAELAELAEPAAPGSPDSPDASDSPESGGICVRNLSFGYPGKQRIFSNASFSLPPGITALIGPNGTGKTTLARLLTGLCKCAEGSFSLRGRPLKPGELLRRASIVLQNADHQLYMNSVLAELTTCLQLAAPDKKARAAHSREALDLLQRFNLQGLAERHPQSLSGGEKQRLVIACALAKKPEILILDEPTSGLDGLNMQRIAATLRDCAGRGLCVLLITHDLELLEATCTQALRLPLSEGVACNPQAD